LTLQRQGSNELNSPSLVVKQRGQNLQLISFHLRHLNVGESLVVAMWDKKEGPGFPTPKATMKIARHFASSAALF